MHNSKSFCLFCIGFLTAVTILIIANRDWIAAAQVGAQSHFARLEVGR